MIRKFARLFDETIVSLNRREILPQRLVSRTVSLAAYSQRPLFGEEELSLKNSKTVDEVFMVLSPHMSIFDFELLKHITDSQELCCDEDRKRMDEYIRKFGYHVNYIKFEETQ